LDSWQVFNAYFSIPLRLRNNGLISEQIEDFVKQFSRCHQHSDIR